MRLGPGGNPLKTFLFVTSAVLLIVLVKPSEARDPAAGATEPPPGLALAVSSNDPLDLFYEDALNPSQPVTLEIRTKNSTGKPGDIKYQWKLTDFWGKTVRADQSTGAVVADGATDTWFLSFHRGTDLESGFYRFHMSARKGRDKADADAAFGVIPRPAPGLRERSLFGIASAATDDRTLSAIQKIGARWLVTDAGVNWYACEPKAKGEYQWDRFDRLATEARSHDLELLPTLDYAPEWAKVRGPDGKPLQYLDAPENVNDHADFVAAAVARYAKEIKYWQTWNEPYVMGWTWHDTAQHYRDMMKADYAAAKKANPDAVILASGANPSHLQDVVFAPGAEMGAYVDVTSVHAYGAGGPEDDFLGKAEHAVLVSKKNGKDRVWITEQGWPLGDDPKLAQYVPRAYVLAALAGVSQVDWFTLADESLGLFTPGFTPRASAVSYSVAAHFLDDTILVRDLWPHSRRIFGAIFKDPQGRKIAVVWAVGDHGSLTVNDAKGVEAFDVMGAPTGRHDGDKLEIPIGEDVVYLTSDGDQAAFIDQVRSGRIAAIDPVEVVVKPFLTYVARTPPIRVQVTNMLNRPIDGDIQAEPPKGWKLAQDRVSFGPLDPGATTLVEIPVRQSTMSPDNAYPVTVTAVSKHKGMASLLVQITGPEWRVRRSQTLFLAAASFGTPNIDGDLSDWVDAPPIHADTRAFVSPWAPEKWVKGWTPGNLSAIVYTMYDDANFYVAAKVIDDFQSGLSIAEKPYNRPWDGDSLQLAFWSPQVTDTTKMKPPTGPNAGRGLLFDTDYEFSLALTPKGPEAVRLHTPESGYVTSYPTNPDVGLGLTSTVKLAVKRDDINEVTTYEAAIPWSELKDIQRDLPFHFAFKVNDRDREGAPTGWIESATGAGELRGNELSFSPTWQYTAANLSDWALLKK